jgi:3-methyl-2-oxobutanoate hydroxymethyltransferase
MDMMIMHGQAVRRGAPNTFMLGCMPYQSYHTVERALANASRFTQETLCDAVKPQGGRSQAHILKVPTASHIGLTPHTIAMFGGFKIQGRTADAAMKILEDALAIEDAGCLMLEFEAVPDSSRFRRLVSAPVSAATARFCSATTCLACSRISSQSSPSVTPN